MEQQKLEWDLLLKAAQDGDLDKQRELIEALNVRLRIIIQYRCWGWTEQDYEDILQETLEVVWCKLSSISDHPEMYALKILKNKIGDELRKRLGRRTVTLKSNDNMQTFIKVQLEESRLPDESCDIEAKIEYEELLRIFEEAILRLTPFCQKFFKGILDGMSINELWEYFSSVYPKLNRTAFDTRNTRCREKLIGELKKLSS